jgi:hypothetical protein
VHSRASAEQQRSHSDEYTSPAHTSISDGVVVHAGVGQLAFRIRPAGVLARNSCVDKELRVASRSGMGSSQLVLSRSKYVKVSLPEDDTRISS